MILNISKLKGKSISVEGGEGAGKGTCLSKFKEYLEEHYIENVFTQKDVLFTREPGGVKISEQIRDLVHDKDNTEMTSVTEMFLYAAARNQHLEEKALPAIEKGIFTVFDRFVDASYVYQGFVRGIGFDTVKAINDVATNGFLPNLTIIFDIEPSVGLGRINSNVNREINRLDLESIEFHEKVRKGYYKLAKMFPKRIVLIDASGTPDEVFELFLNVLNEKLC